MPRVIETRGNNPWKTLVEVAQHLHPEDQEFVMVYRNLLSLFRKMQEPVTFSLCKTAETSRKFLLLIKTPKLGLPDIITGENLLDIYVQVAQHIFGGSSEGLGFGGPQPSLA